MSDGGKREGKGTTRRDVSRLLKVLVAGGVALAGVAPGRAAETPPADKGAPPGDQGTAPGAKSDKDAAKDKDKKKDQDKKSGEKKASDEKKADEGGGVKGW